MYEKPYEKPKFAQSKSFKAIVVSFIVVNEFWHFKPKKRRNVGEKWKFAKNFLNMTAY